MRNEKKSVPTIRDVAKLADISVSTVSRYINQSGYVSSEVEGRIKNAIFTLGYSPSPFARGLKEGNIKQIALIVPDITNPYYAQIYAATQEFSTSQDFTVLLYNAAKGLKDEQKGLDICRNSRVKGIIFCSLSDDSATMVQLHAIGVPTVVSNISDNLLFDTVHSEGGNGIFLATNHMIALGHKLIGYAGGTADSTINQNRKKGYRRALQEAGLSPDSDYIFEMSFSMDSGYKAGMYFSNLPRRPTAIVAANDIIAMGVIMAMKDAGLDIPGDISLSGEDNIEFAKICRPPLTTVDNSPTDFAKLACELLFDRIINKYDGPPRIRSCARELIVRDSTRAYP